MTTLNANETGAAPTTETKPTNKARLSARRAHVPTPKPKPGKKAAPDKEAPKGCTKAKVAKPGAGAAKPRRSSTC
jgi:hypothetical protein